MVLRLLNTLGLIIAGLAAGYLIQRWFIRRRGMDLSRLQRRLQKLALLGFNPIIFIGAVWLVPLQERRLLAMPFVALFALALGGTLAYLLSRRLGLDRSGTGACVFSGWVTNIGSIGALVVFILLGEQAFALVPIYKLFEEFSYYAVGVPLARRFSTASDMGAPGGNFRRTLRDPFVLVATGGILIGLTANAIGLQRPAFWGPLNGVLVPISSFLLLVTIGMTMTIGSVRRNRAPALGIVLIKHLAVPLTTTILAAAIGFGSIQDGTPLRVVLILSSMPAGFVSIVIVNLHRLDVDVANANWILTNAALLLVVPLLALILPHL